MFTGNRGCPKVIAQHERHSEGVVRCCADVKLSDVI